MMFMSNALVTTFSYIEISVIYGKDGNGKCAYFYETNGVLIKYPNSYLKYK